MQEFLCILFSSSSNFSSAFVFLPVLKNKREIRIMVGCEDINEYVQSKWLTADKSHGGVIKASYPSSEVWKFKSPSRISYQPTD